MKKVLIPAIAGAAVLVAIGGDLLAVYWGAFRANPNVVPDNISPGVAAPQVELTCLCAAPARRYDGGGGNHDRTH